MADSVSKSEKCSVYDDGEAKPSEEQLGAVEVSSRDENTTNTGLGNLVAEHYNSVKEIGIIERKKSRIYHMRNFNNWIKSMFINKEIGSLRKDMLKRFKESRKPTILDLCCGKGGDLKKWVYAFPKHVTFADIAETSIEQCKERYNTLKRKNFTAEFIVADCTKTRIRSMLEDVTIQYDLVSCQFAFHYCFESLAQAEMMLKNVSECLRPGGRFIGTLPNATEIVKRIRKNGNVSIGNEIYKITPHCQEPYPIFGAKYDFHLEGAVDCPEFLVHFPTFVYLAKYFGLKLLEVTTVPQFFRTMKDEGLQLLRRMEALEKYPLNEVKLVENEDEYKHVKDMGGIVGTLSTSEWEAASLYLLFTFEKIQPLTYDSTGRPVYVAS